VGPVDLASEWLRLSARYRRMSDGELLQLAHDPAALTEAAQQTLAAELSVRGLKPPSPEIQNVPPPPEPDPDSPYAQDRELVEICKVWSLSDALQLQWLLDRAGIPFYIGPGKATGVETVPLNFGEGVSVQVMRIGVPWAWQAIQYYAPANEPAPETAEESQEIPITCPRCRSEEVIFGQSKRKLPDADECSKSKFAWTCDSCGYQWEDLETETL
jgi:DNA-directed RNA polymerase subunit M/transcription elongation factor TFIIS